jgi:predicted porin
MKTLNAQVEEIMKTKIVGAALLMASVSAFSQSSVTLYGRMNTGIEYINGLPDGKGANHSQWRQEADWGCSLFGLMGSEDIGAGTQVIFRLESQLNIANGNAGAGGSQFFNRYAFVGAKNDRYGTLTMGRRLEIVTTGDWDFDPFGQSNWSSASMIRGRNWPAVSNSIFYQSPNFAGFVAAAQFSLSNSTNWNGGPSNTSGQGREVGAQLSYTTGLFELSGIYDEVRNPLTGQFDDVFNYSRQYFAGLNVFLGPVKLSAAYQTSRASSASTAANTNSTHATTEWGGVTYQVTPQAAIIGAVYHGSANHGGGSATMYTIGGDYFLSKRTSLNFQLATVRNSANANYGLEANGASLSTLASGSASSDNPMAGHSQSGFYVGIQHAF